MSEELQIAIEAAKKGAKAAQSFYQEDIETKYKEDSSPVTQADKETEKLIQEFIKLQDTSAKFVGEETGGDVHQNSFWIIDPIDGTRSYAKGIPSWCSIVSYVKDGKVELSAIYHPFGDRTHYGQAGQGSFINKKRLTVSKTKEINKAFMGFGSPKHFKNKTGLLKLFDITNGARSFEATDCHCYVCEGKMDFSVDAYGEAWDMAPFKVLVEEAGGKITHMDDSEWSLTGKGAVVSNGILHNEVIQILNEK